MAGVLCTFGGRRLEAGSATSAGEEENDGENNYCARFDTCQFHKIRNRTLSFSICLMNAVIS
uniref:Uncharacterized protein n=1 Tax=Arundo donax TaxID=35708 RepID=A0A0A9CAL1_ARUDO